MEYNIKYVFEKSFWYENSSEEKEQFKGKSFIVVGELPSYYKCVIEDESLPTLLSKNKLDKIFKNEQVN